MSQLLDQSVPGSVFGPGPYHRVIRGTEDRSVNVVQINYNSFITFPTVHGPHNLSFIIFLSVHGQHQFFFYYISNSVRSTKVFFNNISKSAWSTEVFFITFPVVQGLNEVFLFNISNSAWSAVVFFCNIPCMVIVHSQQECSIMTFLTVMINRSVLQYYDIS